MRARTLREKVQRLDNIDGKGIPQMEGTLQASITPGCYAIDAAENPIITAGQAIEIFLGGSWIAGRVQHSSNVVESGATRPGAYCVSTGDESDIVTEASIESFPASDAPEWTATPGRNPVMAGKTRLSDGYYFVADKDGSVCGLCIGMHVRTR
jgi:hypothetical protein